MAKPPPTQPTGKYYFYSGVVIVSNRVSNKIVSGIWLAGANDTVLKTFGNIKQWESLLNDGQEIELTVLNLLT